MDSPVVEALNLAFDLVVLNVIFLLCCVPILTVGASLTALHRVLLQMIRHEDSYLVRRFFETLRQEWRQSTVIWLILLAAIVLLVVDQNLLLPVFAGGAFYTLLFVSALVLEGLWFLIFAYVFPLQSRYGNPVRQTFKNALLVGVLNLPYTLVLLLILLALPLVYFLLPAARPAVMILYFICGFSVPFFLGDIVLNRVFLKTFPEERREQEVQ